MSFLALYRKQMVRSKLNNFNSGNKPIQLLFYEPYPMGFGGNFVTQRMILERLKREYFVPIVVSPIEGVALDEFRKMGIECVVIGPSGNLNRYGKTVLQAGIMSKLKAAIDLLRYNIKLTSFLRERKIEIAYANCVRAEMSIGIAARLTRVPSLLYIKGKLNHPLIDWLSFILASKILFFCEHNRDDKYPNLVRLCRKKIDILKIGMDISAIEEVLQRNKGALCKELGIDRSRINVTILAQLYRPKGQHIVLEALKRLVKDFPDIRLYLLGDHVIEEYRPYKKELEEIIKKYNLEKYVQFTGWRRDALDIVSLMDIVIHPSFAEGFGRAVLESMALGKPVIASKVGGLREAIKDGENGFLVEPGDVDAIEQRWRELLEDQELRIRLGQAAKKTVFKEYMIDDKVERLEQIWTEMAYPKV